MEIQIFNSILFGSLKPWKVNQADAKSYASLIKKANATQDIIDRLNYLLEPNPELILPKAAEIQLIQPLYSIDLPEYYDTLSNYYCLLINTESQRIFNVFKIFSDSLKHPIDINHQTNKILRKIKILLIQVLEEIEEIGNEETPPKNFNLTEFVLSYLEKNLFVLYFNIQEINEKHLINKITPEDFHVLELLQPKNTFQNILPIEAVFKKANESKNKLNRFSFGFKGDNKKLQIVLNELTDEIALVNRDLSTIEDLYKILISKNILSESFKEIHLGCETTQFRCIIEMLSSYFYNLTFASVGDSTI
jgi:RNAse (barnase) inhibitor barstar